MFGDVHPQLQDKSGWGAGPACFFPGNMRLEREEQYQVT